MPNLVRVAVFLSLFSTIAHCEFVLRPKDPPTNIETLKETPGHQLVLRCTSPGGTGSQKWLFNGADLKSSQGVISMEGSNSVLTIASFDSTIHAGAYECYEGHLSAHLRLESDVGPPLPERFRPCEGEEKNSCERGSCGVDANNKISCFCPPGWFGSKCDAVIRGLTNRERNTDCLIWIIVGGILAGCIIVFTIIFATYFFCPVKQCKHKEEGLEQGTNLLERSGKAEEPV